MLTSSAGQLSVSYSSSSGNLVKIVFTGVPAFSWAEASDSLMPGEPPDGTCEIFGSSLLSEHPDGKTMYSLSQLRHIRLNFNAWGRLDILCMSFATAA